MPHEPVIFMVCLLPFGYLGASHAGPAWLHRADAHLLLPRLQTLYTRGRSVDSCISYLPGRRRVILETPRIAAVSAHRMPTETVILELSATVSAGLHPPFSPSICVACFMDFLADIADDGNAQRLLQIKDHTLWNRMIAFASAEWTAGRRASVSATLRRSFSGCHCRLQGRTPTIIIGDDYFGVAIELACKVLQLCLVNRIGGHNKGFVSRRGRWPMSAEQLFPYGSQRAIHSLVELVDLYPYPASVIACLVSVHRPATFPLLVEEATRQRLMSAIVTHLETSAAEAESALRSIRQPVLPAVKEAIGQRQLRCCSGPIFLLFILAFGADSELDDRTLIVSGREAELLKPLHSILSLFENPRRAGLPAEKTAAHLWQILWRTERETLGLTAPPPYAGAHYEPTAAELSDPYIAVHHYLPQRLDYRGCYGPSCSAQVHDKPTPGAFARCARCGAVQYCSRACQKADWTRAGPFAHRKLCGMLRELRAAVRFDMDADDFADACRESCVSLDLVARLVAWAKDRSAEHENEEDA